MPIHFLVRVYSRSCERMIDGRACPTKKTASRMECGAAGKKKRFDAAVALVREPATALQTEAKALGFERDLRDLLQANEYLAELAKRSLKP